MNRKIFAEQIVMGTSTSQVVLSHDDIANIVSNAKRDRSEAITENIKEFLNHFETQEPESDFSPAIERWNL